MKSPHTSTLAQSHPCAISSHPRTAWARSMSASMLEASLSKFADAAARVAAAVVRAGEVTDLVERQACALGDIDDRQAVEHPFGVAALPADALRLWEDAYLLVRSRMWETQMPGALGDLADG